MNCYIRIWCTLRILCYQIVTSVFRALLEFLFNGLLHYYLVRFYDLLSMDWYLRIQRTLRILFIVLLRWYLAHFQDYLPMDCYVHSWCTSRILFYQIVTSVSCTLLEFLFNGLFRYYLVRFYDLLSMDCYLSIWRFKDSLSLDCYVLYLTHFKHSFSLDCNVSISRTFRIFFIELLRQSLAHFQDSFSLDCYVSISRTFRVLIDMECYVSLLCLLGFIFDGQFRALSRFSLVGGRLVLWKKYKAHGEVNHRNQEFSRNSIENCSEIKVFLTTDTQSSKTL